MELGNTENNIVLMHRTDELEIEANNVVSMTHAAELHLVELDNVVELSMVMTEELEQQPEGSTGSCANGICSVSWKPKRPTAA